MNYQNSTTMFNGKYFYLNNNSLICSTNNFLKSTRVLDSINGYSVDTDAHNNLNIVAFDEKSNIVFRKYQDGDLNKLINDEKMTGAKSICYVKLFSNNTNTPNMFILTKNPQRNEIYQLINYHKTNAGWRGQRIIDLLYFKKGHPTVKIDMDNNNNFHIIYKEYTMGLYKLKYKAYLSKYNKWSKREVLAKSKNDLNNILMLCDSENNINVSWSTLRDKDIEVKFIKKNLDPYKVTRWEETTSFPFIKNLTNPILLEVDNKIRYGWKQNDTYHYIDTKHDKDSWIRKTSFKLSSTHLSPATYIPDKNTKASKTKIPNTYLYFSNDDYKLLGLDELFPESKGIFKDTNITPINPIDLVKKQKPILHNRLKRSENLSKNHPLIEKSDILKDLKIL